MTCQTYKKLNKERRLNIIGEVLKSSFLEGKFPTITQLARANMVTTATIYRDLEILRNRLGNFYVPNLQLGGKRKHG